MRHRAVASASDIIARYQRQTRGVAARRHARHRGATSFAVFAARANINSEKALSALVASKQRAAASHRRLFAHSGISQRDIAPRALLLNQLRLRV